MRWVALVMMSSLVLLSSSAAGFAVGHLTVMISGGFTQPYRDVVPEFERETGIEVTTLSGASQGAGPQTVKAQLASGADVDVVILNQDGLRELIAAGRIVEGSQRDLATTPLAAAVRKGSPKPDIGTMDGLKRTLLDARLVVLPDNNSGAFVRTEVFSRLGIVGRVSTTFVARGQDSTRMLAAGEADLAIGPASELINQPDVEPIGPLPREVRLRRVFAAGMINTARHTAEAKRLIEFLASDRTAAAIRNAAMEPVGSKSER